MKLKCFVLFLLFTSAVNLCAQEYYDLTPQKEESMGYFLPMSLELIPGAGFLYAGEYKEALMFSVFKFSGLAASVYCFNQAFNGNYSQKMEERYKENFTISASVTATLYVISWIMLYSDISSFNEQAIPMFEISFSDNANSGNPVYMAGFRQLF